MFMLPQCYPFSSSYPQAVYNFSPVRKKYIHWCLFLKKFFPRTKLLNGM